MSNNEHPMNTPINSLFAHHRLLNLHKALVEAGVLRRYIPQGFDSIEYWLENFEYKAGNDDIGVWGTTVKWNGYTLLISVRLELNDRGDTLSSFRVGITHEWIQGIITNGMPFLFVDDPDIDKIVAGLSDMLDIISSKDAEEREHLIDSLLKASKTANDARLERQMDAFAVLYWHFIQPVHQQNIFSLN